MTGAKPRDALVTYRGTVYPWHCDHMGHMNIMWYVGKFDEANWTFFARLGMTARGLRDADRGQAGRGQADRGQAGRGIADRAKAGRGQADRGQAGRGQAETSA